MAIPFPTSFHPTHFEFAGSFEPMRSRSSTLTPPKLTFVASPQGTKIRRTLIKTAIFIQQHITLHTRRCSILILVRISLSHIPSQSSHRTHTSKMAFSCDNVYPNLHCLVSEAHCPSLECLTITLSLSQLDLERLAIQLLVSFFTFVDSATLQPLYPTTLLFITQNTPSYHYTLCCCFPSIMWKTSNRLLSETT